MTRRTWLVTRWLAAACAAVVVILPEPARGLVATRSAAPLTAPPGRMAEATIAVDPARPTRLAAAADPYLDPVRILVTTSDDGGATWSAPIVLVPPGFDKSYDPALRFDERGGIVVVGGASRAGRPYCQPGSVIFMATLAGGRPSYELVRDTSGRSFVDRPGLAIDQRRGTLYVSWTESSGPDAECRGTPLRSSAMVAVGHTDGGFAAPVTLPSTGLPAPFGTTVAVLDDGRVMTVTGEHEPGRRSRVAVAESTDGGASFAGTGAVADGPDVPARLAGLGALFAPVPAVSVSPTGSVAVATWQPGRAGPVPLVVERTSSGSWASVGPSIEPGTVEVFPAVAYDSDGDLWMLSSRLHNAVIDFLLRHRTPAGWQPPAVLASGPSSRYLELGEGFGLATGDDLVATAVPVDAAASSTLVVTVQQFPRTPPSTMPPSTVAPSTVAPAPSSSVVDRGRASRRDASQNRLAVSIAAVAVAVLATLLVRRAGQARHTR